MTKRLPPDPGNMNDDRAAWVAAGLRHFQRITGTDDEDVLGDVLGDLLHWSDRNTVDFEAILALARLHYKAETATPPGSDLARYDAVEIQPVCEHKDDHSCAPVPDAPHTATFWTVYGHLKTGGVEALVDCYDAPSAEVCAAILTKALLVPALLEALQSLLPLAAAEAAACADSDLPVAAAHAWEHIDKAKAAVAQATTKDCP